MQTPKIPIPPKPAYRFRLPAWGPPENPFFTLELRRFLHRPMGVLLGLPATSLALILVLYALHRFLGPGVPLGTFPLRLAEALPALHLLLCLKWGPGRLNRLLNYGSEKSVPDDALLPYRPHQWLWRRLGPGIYATFLLWLAGLPFYPAMATLNLTSLTAAIHLAGQVLVIALAWCPQTLLHSPAYPFRCVERWQYQFPAALLLYQRLLLFPTIVCWLFRGGRAPDLWGVSLPVWALLTLIGLSLLPAALSVGVVVMRGGDRGIPQSRTAFFISFLLLHGLALSLAYTFALIHLPEWGWLAAATVPPIGIWWWLARRAGRACRYTRRNSEIEALARRLARSYPNPIFRLETLRLWRGSHLGRAWLIQVALLGLAGYLPVYVPIAFLLGIVDRYIGGRVLEVWNHAIKEEGVECLFLTPLSSSKILRGKLIAAVTHALLLRIPLLTGGGVLLSRQIPSLLAFTVGYALPVAISTVVCFGANIPHFAQDRDPLFKWVFRLTLLHVIFAAGPLLALTWLPGLQTSPLLPVLSAAHWAAHLVVARHWFRLRVRQLDELRAGIRTLPSA